MHRERNMSEGFVYSGTTTKQLKEENLNSQEIEYTANEILSAEIKQLKAQLKELNSYQSSLLHLPQEVIWAIDHDFKLLFFNQSYAHQVLDSCGIYVEVGDCVLDYPFLKDFVKNARYLFERALAGTSTYEEKLVYTENGKEVWKEFYFNPILLGEETSGVVVKIRDISQNKITERKLNKVEDSLDEVQRIAKIGSWSYDIKTQKIEWSKEIYKILDLEPHTCAPSLAHYLERVHPEDKEKLETEIQSTMNFGNPYRLEYRIISPNSEIKYIAGFGKAIQNRDGEVIKLIATDQDITELRKATLKIETQKEFLENLIENLPIGVFVKDIKNDFKFTIWNRKIEEILGIPRDSVLSKTDEEIFGAAQAKKDRAQELQMIEHNEILSIPETKQITSQGEVLVHKVKVPIKNTQGEPIYLLGIIEDITDRKLKEEELIVAKEKAEKATQAKSEFLSTMSHEIRTPLNAVVGITNLLFEENPQSGQIEKLKTLRFASDSLLSIINDILDYSKIEAGKIEFEATEFELLNLCRNIKLALEYKALEKGIQLNLSFDDRIPPVLIGDSTRLSQILNNLVGNAIKFTNEGSVSLQVVLEEEDKEYAQIFFSVKDTGIGIPEDKQKRIFDSFTQSNSDTTRKYGGTGLGLTITKKLLELQGSTIELKSEHHKGSDFYFRIRYKKAPNAKRIGKQDFKPIPDFKLSDIYLLVAEDNLVNQFVIQNFLKKWEARYDFVEDGRSAVEKVKNNIYDVVLMDLQMPDMDGFEATAAIRQIPGEAFKSLPIIALTASALSEVRDKVYANGMDDLITKPFQPEALYQTIAKHIRKKIPSVLSESKKDTENEAFDLENYLMLADESEQDRRELIMLTIQEFETFKEKYRKTLLERDVKKLRAAIHKNAVATRLLNFQELNQEAQKGKDILQEEDIDNNLILASIQRMDELCDSLIQSLEKLLQDK